uniref:Uncharacterized protein n=1 Tax=Rhizophora mucronata TaxID=61149 RepID=A0A2P2NZI5_RHIMU
MFAMDSMKYSLDCLLLYKGSSHWKRGAYIGVQNP